MSRQNLWVMITVMCASVMYDPVMAVEMKNKPRITSEERIYLMKILPEEIKKIEYKLNYVKDNIKEYKEKERKFWSEHDECDVEENQNLQDECDNIENNLKYSYEMRDELNKKLKYIEELQEKLIIDPGQVSKNELISFNLLEMKKN